MITRGDHSKIQQHAQPIRMLQTHSRPPRDQAHGWRLLKFGGFVFFFSRSFPRLVRELLPEASLLRRLPDLLLLRSLRAVCCARNGAIVPARITASNASALIRIIFLMEVILFELVQLDIVAWLSTSCLRHQRPAPAGSSTRRMISMASACT